MTLPEALRAHLRTLEEAVAHSGYTEGFDEGSGDGSKSALALHGAATQVLLDDARAGAGATTRARPASRRSRALPGHPATSPP